MKGSSYITDLRGKLRSIKELAGFRSLIFIFAVGLISFGIVGGCNNGGGSGEADVVVLGDHRQPALDDISEYLNIGQGTEEPNNILLDGSGLKTLSDEEIEFIRDSFNLGFIIFTYQMNAADTCYLYSEILQHPLLCTEDEDRPDGNMHEVYAIEQHDGVIWVLAAQFGVNPDVADVVVEDVGTQSSPAPSTKQITLEDTGFLFHGAHMEDWIDSFADRAAQFELMSENEEAVTSAIRDAAVSGTITNLAQAWIQTNKFTLGIDSEGTISNVVDTGDKVNTYQQTSMIWVATEDTPNGITSFVYVNQDMLLASSNGFIVNTDNNKGWYLAEYTNKNYLLDSSYAQLDTSTAQLLNNQPDTNQATTMTTTVSVSASLGGDVGLDSSGGSTSVSGGITWSTSNTFSKANVSINNISLSFNGNDASWSFFPRSAEPIDDSCQNTIGNLADLSHNTFSPSQAFIYRLDGSLADTTVVLETDVDVTIRQTTMDVTDSNCNIFHCNCDAHNNDFNYGVSYTQTFHVPAEPSS